MTKEIYYPDGSMGILTDERVSELKTNPPMDVINPPLNVVNPGASSKHNILATIDGVATAISVGLFRVSDKDVTAKIKRKMRDVGGKLVTSREYLKSTGQMMDEAGRGKKLMNEDNKEVASSEVKWFIDTPEGEKEVVQFSKTDDIQIKEMPAGTEDSYVVARTFEVVPDNEDERVKLWKLAQHLKSKNAIGVGLVVFEKGWEKHGILFVPYIDEKNGRFAMLAKSTSKKFKLDQPQPIPVAEATPKKKKMEMPSESEELFK